jgi:hypothetical protein
MFLRNTSRYPDAEVKGLIDIAAKSYDSISARSA